MISLKDLARLANEHAEDLDHPVAPFVAGDRVFDTDARHALMGVINLSRDSSYRESIVTSAASAVRRGRVLVAQGADFVDLGAESSRNTAARVSADGQLSMLLPVIEELAAEGVLISVETYDPEIARAGLKAGARILNLTGSDQDDTVFDLAAEYDASVILCHVLGAHARQLDRDLTDGDPVPDLLASFEPRLEAARERGVRSVAIDPGLGFGFKLADQKARARHQTNVLLNSFRLRRLGVTICHSPPHSFEIFEDQFRTAEGFFSVLAHLGGTGIYRTHEVPHVRAVLDAVTEL